MHPYPAHYQPPTFTFTNNTINTNINTNSNTTNTTNTLHYIPIQLQSYIPNTLRKNRQPAFQSDITTIYNKYIQLLKNIMVQQVTINMFSQIWASHNMQYIYQCLSQQQSQQQFANMTYECILKMFILGKSKQMQIFGIFALYFMYYASQLKIRVQISPLYLYQIGDLVQQNRNDKNSHYMKIAYQLFQKCFSICTKVGLRNPIVKYNGEPPRKPLIVSINPTQYMDKIQPEFKSNSNNNNNSMSNNNLSISNENMAININMNMDAQMNSSIDANNINSSIDTLSLKQSLTQYDKLKREIFLNLKDGKDKFVVDVYFSNRVQKLIKNYKEFANSVEYCKKKQDDNQ